jgi:DNA-binding CsgD family transcriptional regulator/sugar-specific transcriptional regulator TrmB
VATSPSGPGLPDLSALGVLGFSAQQERVYRLVLRGSGSTLARLAAQAGLPVGELREQLSRFATRGLLELDGDTVVARAPQEVLGRLVSEESRRVRTRAEQLDTVQDLLPSLTADYLSASVPRADAVTLQVLDGADAMTLVRSLSAETTGELLWLRPDPWNVAPSGQIDAWVEDLLRSGRRSRVIYSVTAFERDPGLVRRRADAGERVRVLAEVPTRMAVLGTSAVMLPERLDVLNAGRLLLRQPALVAALTLWFDALWDRAMPVPGLDSPQGEGLSDQRTMLEQLVGGAKDEQIARALGLSVRTVRRRVADLLEDLGAHSRFQAGVEATRRGWL